MSFYGYSSFDLFYLPSIVGTECNSALAIVDIRAIGRWLALVANERKSGVANECQFGAAKFDFRNFHENEIIGSYERRGKLKFFLGADRLFFYEPIFLLFLLVFKLCLASCLAILR